MPAYGEIPRWQSRIGRDGKGNEIKRDGRCVRCVRYRERGQKTESAWPGLWSFFGGCARRSNSALISSSRPGYVGPAQTRGGQWRIKPANQIAFPQHNLTLDE